MKNSEPLVLQVYCRVEVVVDDPELVLDLAERRLREAGIDWPAEHDTVENAVAEMRRDLAESVASLVDPDRLLDSVPGVEVRRARWWAELGAPSGHFHPG